MIVNARMYSATPEAKSAWNAILGWVIERAGLSWELRDYEAPAPLATLWARTDLGCALMCGLPYSQRRPRPTLIAAPVPSPSRYAGQPIYFTDIAVRADAPFARLEDTFGGVVGYTLRDSMSGCIAVRSHPLKYRRANGGPLYREAVGDLVNARGVIEALAARRIDVGPLDSYSHDLLKVGDPALASQVKTIASTQAAPMPPFVATAAISASVLAGLRAALDLAGTALELSAHRAALLLERFAVPSDASYDIFDSVLNTAERYPDPW